jgi:hypothetical protein
MFKLNDIEKKNKSPKQNLEFHFFELAIHRTMHCQAYFGALMPYTISLGSNN